MLVGADVLHQSTPNGSHSGTPRAEWTGGRNGLALV